MTTDLPALATVPDVDLVAAGTWKLSTGEATFTTDDLAAAVEAAQCPAVGCPVIKLGHVDPRFDGEPAVGRVANMSLASGGQKITGDLAGMPGWLAAVMSSAYPQRSIEGSWGYQCQIGHVHPFVITALALLGTSAPGVGVLNDLDDVAALYGLGAVQAAAGRQGDKMAGVALAAGVTTEDVRRAYYDASETPYSYWITEIQIDPPQLIVSDEATAKVYRVPLTISGGDVTFGSAQEVEVEYVDVKQAAAGSGIRWGSAAASRKLDPAKPVTGSERLAGLRARQQKIRAAGADADDNVRALIASLDATLDQASQLSGTIDRSSVQPDVGQALDLITAAEAIADQLMDMLGITDPDDDDDSTAAAGAAHAALGTADSPVTHSHPHQAYGSQGGDDAHGHSHSHSGDANHKHAHATAAGGNRRGGSEVDFTDEQTASLRAALGLADDAELDEATLLASVAGLAEKASTGPVAAAAGNSETMLVSREAWDAMQTRVRAGEAARAQQLRDQRDTVIAAAVRDGKFSVAQRSRWEKLWDRDSDGTRAVIASLAKNVVPVDDIGSAGGEAGDLLDEEYRSLFPPGATAPAGQER